MATWTTLIVLVAIVVVFAGIRLATDVPNIVTGRQPDADAFEARYAAVPWLAYAHILPGVLYLTLAPIQLWRGFRNRHLRSHRRIGRVALAAGLLSGLFGVTFGILMSFGGILQATASAVFGTWFVMSLLIAYRAIGLAVGTIRLWIGLFEGMGILAFREAFGVAFWLAFIMHAVAAELWLRWRPLPTSGVRSPA